MERDKLLEELYCAIREKKLNDLKKLLNSLNLSKKEIRECLYGSVLYNQTDATRLLLESKQEIIPKDRRCPYLYIAATNSNLEIVEMILGKVDEIDKFLAPFLLELSVIGGNGKVVELILSKGVSVHSKIKGPFTSIHIAVEKCHVKIIEYLLTNGANVNSTYDKQRHNCTLLRYAVGTGNEAIVQLLLKHGAKVDVKATDGSTPIHVAVENGFVQITKLLIQKGANVNSEVNKVIKKEHSGELHNGSKTSNLVGKYTLLHIASERGYDEMVQLLLQNKASATAVDSSGKTAFYVAAERGHSKVVKVFFDFVPAIALKDDKGETILHDFSAGGFLKSVETMLQCGLSVDCKNSNDRTPLFLAAKNGHEETVRLLVKHGADINYKNEKGWTPLHFYSTGGREISVECLLKCGAKVDSRDSKGRTSLHFAAQSGHVESVKSLLKHGAEVDSSAADGTTPLSVSALKSHTEVVQVLLKSGASVGSRAIQTILYDLVEDGRDKEVKLLLKYGAKFSSSTKNERQKLTFLLFQQAGRGSVEIVEALLKSGAPVDSSPHPEKKTPLFIAAEFGRDKVVKLLLDSGADVNSRNIHGETPLVAAVFLLKPGSDHMNSIKVLLEYGARVDDADYSANRNTPLSMATEKYWLPEVLRTLLEYASVDAAIVRESNMHFLFFTVNKYGPICHLVPENIPAHGVNTAEILVQHTIKMEAAQLYADADNFKAKTYCNKATIRNFQTRCKKEIARMKVASLDGANVTFYDALTKHPYQVARAVKNDNAIQAVRLGNYKKQFPIYANNISNQFEKGKLRNRLLEEGVKICGSLLFKHLAVIPAELIEKILDYLSNCDLRSLTRTRTQNTYVHRSS